MLEFVTNRQDLSGELTDVVRAFVPDWSASELRVSHCCIRGDRLVNRIEIDGEIYTDEIPAVTASDRYEYTRREVRACKKALYKALESRLNRSLPWGSLTGIRPTKLAYQLLTGGVGVRNLAESLTDNYYVSPAKAALAADVVHNQAECVAERIALCENGSRCGEPVSERAVNLYIHVPFCPTKCSYCSFLSIPIETQKRLVQPYIDALCSEITRTAEELDKQNKRIFSVYVGGGTPTAVTDEQLNKLLSAVPSGDVEFTCEAGRPDTIIDEKMRVLAENGVNRISVNPQSLNDATLVRIGRNHTAQDFFVAYETAGRYGFRKNVDLIAGLEGESLEDFTHTLESVLALRPENITVHTLCRKRGSKLIESDYRFSLDVEAMVNFSVNALYAAGYAPYYLYRQKQMLGNLENIGWTLPGFQCVNNITTMEETLSVAACGAGAISKRVFPDNKIERLANVRDIALYLDQFEERLKKKQLFFAI